MRIELDRRAENAVLLTSDLLDLNRKLARIGGEQFMSGAGVTGLLAGPKGYITKALANMEKERELERERKREQRRNQERGMRF